MLYCAGGAPPSFRAFAALAALVALGTLPSVPSLMSVPVKVLSFASTLRTWPFLIFVVVTAFFFNCGVPTLFFGSDVAAHATPLIAMNTAMLDITFAYVS